MERLNNSSDNPTVGIIVPIYNTEKYIERCLKSILDNTYSNIKVFCIDDGSKDESPAIVEKIAKNDCRVVLISQDNSGVSAARNRGIEAAFDANCEVIGFVDSDDWIHPQYIEILLSGIIGGYDISICDNLRSKTFCDNYNSVCKANPIEYDLYCIANNRTARVDCWGRIYRTTAIKNVRFLENLNLSEDELFNISVIISEINPKICWINEKLYYYFDREGSLTHSYKGTDLLIFTKECMTLLGSCNDKNKKSFLTKIIFTRTFCARYLSKFDSDFSKTDRMCKDLLKETWNIVKKDKIVLKRKFVFRLFSAFPSLYRLFSIVNDRTMLDWEKAQKKKNR